MWIWLLALGALSLQAAPSGMPVAPLGNQQRAYESLDRVVGGAFVEGNWALKMHMANRQDDGIWVESMGGFDSLTGRWQRVRLQDNSQYLIDRGQVWDLNKDAPQPMDAMALNTSIVPGITWGDFSFSFLMWQKRGYDGVERIRGRYCDMAVLHAQDGRSARIWLDTEFSAPLQVKIFDAQGDPIKTIRVISLQKTQDQWILRRWQALDHVAKRKVDIEVVAIALNQNWSGKLRDPRITSWPENIQWSYLQ